MQGGVANTLQSIILYTADGEKIMHDKTCADICFSSTKGW
jgi:hypothetical protein